MEPYPRPNPSIKLFFLAGGLVCNGQLRCLPAVLSHAHCGAHFMWWQLWYLKQSDIAVTRAISGPQTHKWIAKCKMQEIIEENAGGQELRLILSWIAMNSHSAVIMLSWLLFPLCAMPGHAVHVVTVTMTHVLLSPMSVYLDLTWHRLYLPGPCWYQSHQSGTNIVLSSQSAACHYQGCNTEEKMCNMHHFKR